MEEKKDKHKSIINLGSNRAFLLDKEMDFAEKICELFACGLGDRDVVNYLSIPENDNAERLVARIRELEKEVGELQTELGDLATGNLEAQHRAAKENTKLREKLRPLDVVDNRKPICRGFTDDSGMKAYHVHYDGDIIGMVKRRSSSAWTFNDLNLKSGIARTRKKAAQKVVDAYNRRGGCNG